MNQSSMFPSHEHIGSKISAKIKIYVPSPEQNYFVHFAMRYVPNIKIDLHIFPGFGDAVNNADCWSPVINYVERQFDKYLDAETRVERYHSYITKAQFGAFWTPPPMSAYFVF